VSGHCRITPDGSPGGLGSGLAGEFAPAVGRIETLVGSCTVSRSGASPIQLSVGDLVGPSDVIETSAGGRLNIRFADGTAFTLSDNARMALKNYVDSETATVFDIDRGTFSFIAGKMAEAGRLGIQTPLASLRPRRNGGGLGMLSLVSLFFAAFEAHAKPSGVAFLDDGHITSKDLGQFGVVELIVHATPTSPEQHRFIDDPGETIVIRAFGSSVSVDSVTNSIAQMVQYQAAQQEALHTFSVGLQGQGPTGNGGGGSSTLLPPEILPPPQNINFVIDNNPPPNFTPPPGGGTTQQNNVPDPPLVIPPPPPPPPPAPGLLVEVENHTGDPSPDTTTGTLTSPGISAGTPTFVWSGGALTPGDQSNLAAQSTLAFTGSGPNDFTFHIADQNVDFLAAGETLTVTYNVTVAGGGTQQAIITVFGTQDTPVLVADASGPHTVTEIANDKNDSTPDQTVPGTLTFTDVDLNDTHAVSSSLVSATLSGGGALPSGLSTALANALSLTLHDSTPSQTGVGSVGFAFSAADKNFDFLAEGRTLTVVYNVTVTDNFGATSTQSVTVTIIGTNDVPTIDAASNPAAILEVPGDSHAQDIPQVNGTVTITDLDIGDTLTVSVTGNAAASYTPNGGVAGALPVEDSVNVAALIASGAITFDALTSNGGQQTIGWHYNPAAADLDWLRQGDTLTLTYVAQVNDGHGNVGAQNLVITITGTNDVPNIDTAANPTAVPEVPGDSHAQDIPQVNGTISITDQDLGDTLTASVIANAAASYNGGAVPIENSVDVSALIASGAVSFDPVISDGEQRTISWHYNPAVADLDWLRQGDTLTLTYVAQVDDGHGHVGAQDLVITITGTNDVPTIDAATNPSSIAEVIGDSHAQDIPQVDGTISITDQDLGDTLTVSVAGNATASYTPNGGVAGALPAENSVNVAALIASGAISFDPLTSDGEQQTIGWHYNPAAADLDWLRQGDTLTLTFVAQVDDGHGNVGAQNLVITITGTNDVPSIDAATNPTSIAEIIGDSHAQDIPQVNGTISITDQDLGDTLTVSVAGNATASYTPNGGVAGALPAENSVNVAALIASGAVTFSVLPNSTGEQQTIGWHYNPAAADLDWLRQGDTLTITYVAKVNDGHVDSNTQNLVITITGTNDVPSIDAATNPAPILEVTGDSHAQDIPQVNGTISITDQDLGDTLTVSVTGNATASYKPNGGVAGSLPVEDSVNVAALIASGAISFDPLTSDGEQQTIGWHYDPAAADLDWLRQGDTLTLTYIAQVNDGHGNVGAQNLVITITGTNDVPTIDGATNPAPIAESVGDSHAQDIAQVNGTISITDQDLGDTLTVSVTNNATATYSGGNIPAADVSKIAALIASGAVTFDAAASNGEQKVIGWHYDPAVADLDWLAQGDTLTLTYVARVNDGHGNVGSQDLVITITGTNDAPVLKYDGAFVLDQFNTRDYGAWVEQNDDFNAVNGSAIAGEFQVAHDPTTAANNFQIKLTDQDAETGVPDLLTRTVNLTGATAATLTFDYRRDIPNGETNDKFFVLASTDGVHFTQIGQIGTTGNGSFVDASYQTFTFDLTPYISAHTIIQFSVGDDVDDGDIVYVDNFKIAYSTAPALNQSVTYTENSAVGVFTHITDVDNGAVVHSAAVTLTNHQANDLLSVTGALPAGISASSYNAITGVLTLTGTASLADYQTALSHILFSNTGDNPNTTDRALTVTVNDGLADSSLATTTIHVTAIDDAPVTADDHVITNFGNNSAIQIPDSALLANDTDPDSTLAQLSITATPSSSSGGVNHSGSAVNFTDTGNNSPGGSFDYTVSDGTLSATGHVTVTDVSGTTLNGTAGNDIFIAKSGGSTMNGGGGNDVFIGNTGADIMNGGSGSDTFVFKATTDSSAAVHDTINNFTHGTDHLDFTAIAGATQVQANAVAALNTVDAHSISWFVDGVNNQTIVYVNTTNTPNTVSMEVHLTGANINLTGADILHHS
jgi:VCBS repeat-containing protein